MRSLRIIAALVPAVLWSAAAIADEPVPLRIGWVVVPSDLAPLMLARPELSPHAGKTYAPQLTHFSGTSTIVTALAAGELDMAAIAYSTFAIAVENAGLTGLRIVADSFMDGIGDYHTNDFMVRADSPYHTIEDLKGKVFATNEAGSAIDMALRAYMVKHGMDDKRDANFIEIPFPEMKATLKEGKVDLIASPSPFDYDPELRSFARTIFTQKDGIGPSEMIMRVVRGSYIAEHRAAVVDFMEDYLRTLHYVYDPAHRTEAVALVAQMTKQKPEFYDKWLFTKSDYYREPNALPDLDVLQANIETQRKLGFLKSDLDAKSYADLTIVKEASARLDASKAESAK
jgi:sulfonate transport system substrate-binding protein